jgi:hypothetical protein
MSGVIPLSKVQIGREATLGTAVDATDILRVEGAFLDDQREIMFIPENVGVLVDVDRTAVPALAAAISIPDNVATFEQILHILEMGIRTVSPSQDGAGSDYIYTYNLPTTAQLTPKSYTIEGGDDQQAMVMEGVYCESFSIKGKVKEPIMFSANLIGRQTTNDTFTAALEIPTVEEMLFQKSKIYIGDVANGFGLVGDLFSDTLLGFTLNVNTGYVGRFTADGNLYYSYLKQVKPEVTLELIMEHNAASVLEITDGRNQTTRAVRILTEGNAVTTPGTTYSKKTMILDLAGRYAAIPPIDNDDGSSILNFTLNGRYNSDLESMGKIIVVNETESLDEVVS